MTSLSFSRDGGVLASASNDLSLNIWDFAKFASELNLEEVLFRNCIEKTMADIKIFHFGVKKHFSFKGRYPTKLSGQRHAQPDGRDKRSGQVPARDV